jgi:hypothetical protein
VNDPPASAGGIRGSIFAVGRLGLNYPPPAGGGIQDQRNPKDLGKDKNASQLPLGDLKSTFKKTSEPVEKFFLQLRDSSPDYALPDESSKARLSKVEKQLSARPIPLKQTNVAGALPPPLHNDQTRSAKEKLWQRQFTWTRKPSQRQTQLNW